MREEKSVDTSAHDATSAFPTPRRATYLGSFRQHEFDDADEIVLEPWEPTGDTDADVERARAAIAEGLNVAVKQFIARLEGALEAAASRITDAAEELSRATDRMKSVAAELEQDVEARRDQLVAQLSPIVDRSVAALEKAERAISAVSTAADDADDVTDGAEISGAEEHGTNRAARKSGAAAAPGNLTAVLGAIREVRASLDTLTHRIERMDSGSASPVWGVDPDTDSSRGRRWRR